MTTTPWTQLSVGDHTSPADGACLMEAVSWLAGEPWSDAPECVPPRFAALCRQVNDEAVKQTRILDDLPTHIVGRADLDRVCARVEARILREVIPEGARSDTTERVARLLDRRASGDEPTPDEWRTSAAATEATTTRAAEATAWAAVMTAVADARARWPTSAEAADARAAAWVGAWVQIAHILHDEVTRP